jgi:superfamily I DNA/RNA helicase
VTDTKLILGGPGCGKTTRLLDIVEEEMHEVPSTKVAFVAYTTAAANEAKDRAGATFRLNVKKDLPWFRTIHSLAYRQTGVMRDEVLQRRDWDRFGKVIGERITGGRNLDDDAAGATKGDHMLQMYDYSRTTFTALEDVWNAVGTDVCTWWELDRFGRSLEAFKQQHGKIDFTDMLLLYLREGGPVNVAVAVIDEAQDLTPLQWRVVERAFSGALRHYVGGDDDQAIYKWAGADVNHFLSLNAEREVLPKSHRMRHNIWAFSQQLAKRIMHRYEKPFASEGTGGSVVFHQRADQVDLAEGSWLLLARNGFMLRELEAMVWHAGYPYRTRRGSSIRREHMDAIYGWEAWRKGKANTASVTRMIYRAMDLPEPTLNDARPYTAKDLGITPHIIWHEALIGIPAEQRTYYVGCLRRGEKLRDEPRIRIDTIHGVKGAEADNVLLMTDMSQRTHASFRADPDSEHRVFYVGCTRARYNLHIIGPQSPLYYPL